MVNLVSQRELGEVSFLCPACALALELALDCKTILAADSLKVSSLSLSDLPIIC